MAFNVELWEELTDTQVVGRMLGLHLPEVVVADPRVVVLRWVDRWGDTVFNRAQCAQLLVDLEIVADHLEKAQLSELRELARRAIADVHLYLVFVGD